ncbi:hypothetical protein KI387_033021, partial [Taxus chinensis]
CNAESENSSTVMPAINQISTGEKVLCINAAVTKCFGKLLSCPSECPKRKPLISKHKACFADCGPKCEATCKNRKPNCQGYGAICYDPRLIGGDGVMFYFHGETGKDFSLISDKNFQINAHFIGRRPHGRRRDYTWVQSLGIMFGTHSFTVGANKVDQWDDNADQFYFSFDNQVFTIPPGPLSVWKSQSSDLAVERTTESNNILIAIPNMLELYIGIVPITEKENEIHNYQIPSDDCFAHLQVQFNLFHLSENVEGVLGQTYRPDFKNPVKVGVPMPIMGGEDRYQTSSLLATDCRACIFKPNSSPHVEMILGKEEIASLDCST